ncbi:UNVERIFIED_CONTAM: Retrovirus-related Pol polyprotein from transposon opus [Sesamum latifolium]|uniref:Retrovirus-related Pol polyprotein from transposon opus n=1 Tax=Sesamum latifolium TaxID=2727402 RepID=A0AAW2WCZ2_9LAMI
MSIQLVPGEPNKTTKIGSQPSPRPAGQLTTFVQQNADIFAWTANDLTGAHKGNSISRMVIQRHAGCPNQGYHKIMLNPDNQKRVSFITSGGTYCYIVMPFGLKNAGATYQRLVDRMLKEELGRNMEVYIDDMLVKSRQIDRHLVDLAETFNTLRRYRMKLNPAKCAFGVKNGKFLGYLVTEKEIKVNPEKIQAIQEMKPPTNLNEVQRLAGRIATFGRFISRSIEWSLPFFKALRKSKDLTWDEECQQEFQELKVYLAQLPLLTKLVPGKTLYLYLAAGPQAVNSVLIKEEEGLQKPIYYVTKVLHGTEHRYPEVEKLAFALITAARKLRPYFLSHSICVRTNAPLRATLGEAETLGRMVKWAIELSEYDISYQPRSAIKAQALAEFVQEAMFTEGSKGPWLVHIDGSSTLTGSGAGVVLTSPEWDGLEYALHFDFKASNKEAEYEALIAGLRWLWTQGLKI